MGSARILTDNNGFFINDIDKTNIQDLYYPAIVGLNNNFQAAFRDKLHSVYLRGSVARGEAKPPISDLDILCIVQGKIQEEEKEKLTISNEFLLQKNKFISRFDCEYINYHELLHNSSYIQYQFIVKHLSVCIFGLDISPRINRFKLGKEIIEHLPQLRIRIERIKQKLCKDIEPAQIKIICTHIMKSIVRSGFELCIENENFYTKDLNECTMIFYKYYPAQKEKMKLAFLLAIEPTDNKAAITQTLDELGIWLVQTFEKQK